MTFLEITGKILSILPAEAILKVESELIQPRITASTKYLSAICELLHKTEGLYFDFLSCITGIDNGPVANSMEVIYHLYSIPYNHNYVVRVELPRTFTEESSVQFANYNNHFLPVVSTVSNIWGTANWHERETFDLLGIWFEGHPDLRRILLPHDWDGFPLRKDYANLETYHGIKVSY